MTISRVFHKTKLLIKRLHVTKPFFLKWIRQGLINFHISNFEFSNSRPGSALGSRVSIFSDDQEGRKIPIVEQQDSRMKHLAVKAEEWNEPGVREGIYTASLMYIRTNGNESSG